MRLLSDLSGHLMRGLPCVLATALILQPLPVMAQSFCGPVTLASFNGINGQYPTTGVTFDSQGNMYGTTAQGGPTFNPLGSSTVSDGLGTIWKYSPTAGLTSLFSFSGAASPANNGYRPSTPLLIDAQGNLYGTTYYGGNDFSPDINGHLGLGTVFKLSAAGQFTLLHEFSGPDGENPVGMLRDNQGNLFGTTWQGGANVNPTLGDFGLGTIFEYSSGGVFSNPVIFSSTNGGGNVAAGLVADGLGNFYGTSYEGGSSGSGSIYKYSPANGLSTLVNFTGPNGSLPSAAPIIDSQGNLYGTTLQGGAFYTPSNSCCGTIWKYSTTTGAFTTLVSFDGDTVSADGMFPSGGVTLDSNGNLYGGTIFGGSFGDGIVYEYSTTGQLSTLVTFSGPNGWNPEGNLTFDSAGNLYGVTNEGGTSSFGNIFKLTPNTSGAACGGATLSSLAFNPVSVRAGAMSLGTVTLTEVAPAGGTSVGLSSNNAFGLVPATVTVPAGASSGTFTFTAKAGVLSNDPVKITASVGNSALQATVTITPASTVFVSSVSLNPASVSAGSNVDGSVTLNTAAPSGGAVVTLSSSNTAVATVPASVTVQAGKTGATFSGHTQKVTSNSSAVIAGTFGGISQSATLTVTAKN
jgi:uncharacterized repeat protein (TIGR03803 family)